MFRRDVTTLSVTIPNGADMSDAFDLRFYSVLTVSMPAAWTSASVGFQECATRAGVFLPLHAEDGAVLEIAATANKAYVAPAEIAAAHWVRLWSQTAGSGVAQGADRVIRIDMKS